MWRMVPMKVAVRRGAVGLGRMAARIRQLWASPAWVDVRWGVVVFLTSLVGIVEVGVIVAATGGLPNVYVNLYYPVLAVAAFSLPMPVAVALALVAGLVPSHEGLLNVHAIVADVDGLVRPATFVVMSGAISMLSGILRRQLEQEKALRLRLQEEARGREEARRAAEESEQELRLLLDHVQDMIIFVDLRGIIVEVNPAVEALIGWRRQDVVGKGIREFVHPEDMRRFVQGLEHKALAEGRCKLEGRFRARDGRWLVAEAVVVPVRRHGQPVGWVITAHDITARRKAEAERAEALLRLLAAQDEERRRVGYDFHDGPLQAMSTALSFLEVHARRHRKVGEELTRAIDSLRQAVQEARYIICHMSPRELEEGGLPKALSSLLQDVRRKWGIDATLEVEGEGWRMEYPREAALLRIAQEAVNNAVKHSGSPRIRVRLWREGDKLCLSVRDWGRGIQADAAPRGTHLGILSMQERARLLRGRLEFRSAPGMGTEVLVTVPLREAGEGSGA